MLGLLLLPALLPLGLPPVCGPLLLWLSTFAPPDPGCGAGKAQHWAALLQGLELDCPERLLEGERSRWMLRKVAADADQPVQARVSALGALAAQATEPLALAAAIKAFADRYPGTPEAVALAQVQREAAQKQI